MESSLNYVYWFNLILVSFVYLEYRPPTTMRVKRRAPEAPTIMPVPPAHNPLSEDSVRNCIVLLFALVGAVYLCTKQIK